MLRGWQALPVLRHDGDGGQRLHAGLADRDEMGVRPDRLDEPDQVADIVVEAEAAVRQADVARVVPVGDVDVVIAQQACVTVPRSSVAKWPDSGATTSTLGWTGIDVLLEIQQRAERQLQDRTLGDARLRDCPL